jgi:hypothetical protein
MTIEECKQRGKRVVYTTPDGHHTVTGTITNWTNVCVQIRIDLPGDKGRKPTYHWALPTWLSEPLSTADKATGAVLVFVAGYLATILARILTP